MGFNAFEQELDAEKEPEPLAAPKEEKPAHPPKKVETAEIKRIVEALLFVSSEPLPIQKVREIVSTRHKVSIPLLTSLIAEMNQDYLDKGCAFQVDHIAEGYLLRTRPEYAPFLRQLGDKRRHERLSTAAAEVLAIIAYKQPITRPQVDAIRGVDSSSIIATLIERELVEVTGKLEAPGRPALYGITQKFLQHFGLKDLSALPTPHKAAPEAPQEASPAATEEVKNS